MGCKPKAFELFNAISLYVAIIGGLIVGIMVSQSNHISFVKYKKYVILTKFRKLYSK